MAALPSPEPAGAVESALEGPVVVVLPVHDEEHAIADVLARVPTVAWGRPVRVVVVDDGSSDRSAWLAARAHADVVAHDRNRGLGAAVRTGFARARELDAWAVAFLDADGEYDPGELDALLAPIAAGEADYVVGTRFGGRIDRMLVHRRLGNRAFTALTRRCAGVPLTDANSGFRALSGASLAVAEVLHDYNYAQILTIDLVGKGMRYAEVPISYRWRDSGRSFVTPGRYLRHVLPAMARATWRARRARRVARGARGVAGV
jgi:glycosyltransferase involved in cell wall biosynthesis